MMCQPGMAPSDVMRQLVGLATCCMGATLSPVECTCWVAEYDLEQQPLDTDDEPGTRSTMCDDCAYRPTSPERTGDPSYVAEFDTFAATNFWCHQGMRKPLRWRHQSLGIVVEASGDFYEPPQRIVAGQGIPYKADGRPGDRCAGWAAHQRASGGLVTALLSDAADELDTLG